MTKGAATGRYLAVEALVRQEQNGYSNLVLDAMLRRSGLEPREKAFASAVFYGVLERQFTLDWMLAQCLRQPLAKLDAPVRAILRAGLYQAVYMDSVPVSAAVNESVALTRAFRKASAAGFVNAVLRRAAAQQPDKASFADPAQALSVKCSVSLPIARAFLEWYGPEAKSILAAFFQKPPLALRANTLRTTPQGLCEALAQEGWTAAPGPVPGSVIAEGKGSIVHTKAFEQGLFHVQGLASQLACLCLDAKPGHKTVDACAAPGGKSATLAQYMENTGSLWCGELSAARTPLISQTLERLGITVGNVRCQDASEFVPDWQQADRVLCDVPCSGLGILAKKPDIRAKRLENQPELWQLQAKILDTCSRYVKQGGKLVYSTCTLCPDENQRQVEAFLQRHPDFRLAAPAFVPQGCIPEGDMLVLRPDQTGFDGFFVATMERL